MFKYDKTIDLIGYLPRYYYENAEFSEIHEAETPELETLVQNINIILNNQFIEFSDERTIKKWEKILNLKPDLTKLSLEQRKEIVLMKLRIRAPLSFMWLINYLDNTIGEKLYSADLYPGKYYLRIRIVKNKLYLEPELISFLREALPANILLDLREYCKTWGDVKDVFYKTWDRVLGKKLYSDLSKYSYDELSEFSYAELEKPQNWDKIKEYELKE